MATQVSNPAPKARFMESGDNISKHRAMVDSPEFNRGADFALLQYQGMLTQQVTNGNEAAAVGFKVAGALEFLQTFKLLAETTKVPGPVALASLDHNV